MTIAEYKVWFEARYSRTSSFVTVLAFMFSDLVAIMCCIGAGFFVINAINHSYINFKSFINYWTYFPFFFIVYNIFKLYPGILLVPSEQLRSFFLANAFMFGGIALSIVIETDGKEFIAYALLIAFLFSIIVLPLSRSIARNGVYSKFRWWGIPAAVYGEGEAMHTVLDNLLDHPQAGYIPVAIVSQGETGMAEYRGIPVLNSIEDSKKLYSDLRIKMAIILPGDNSSPAYKHLIITTLSTFRYNIIIPNLNFYNTISMTVRDINGTLCLSTTQNLTKWYNTFLKRLLDILMLIVGGSLVVPFMLVIALLIKISSPGPVLYGHGRIGKNGKKIKVWKFRSMAVNADQLLEKLLAENPKFRSDWEQSRKLTDDPRITPIGSFLRKTSLDELPQLYNILKGEMSFIGPRPVTRSEVEKYGDNFDYVFSVKPGLSGMWQVSGRSDTDYAERVAFDSYYIQNWSLWLDIWLIIRTIGVVLSGKGAR